jgi:competence protein ComEC
MQPAIRLCHNILWQASIVSIAATLATLPVTLAHFHQFYPYFLLANVVIVPLGAFLLAFSLLYMALPCVAFAFLAEWPLRFCDWLTNGISRLPGAVIADINPSPWTIALLSMAIIFILIAINTYIKRYTKKINL